jgi:hypothetical protein
MGSFPGGQVTVHGGPNRARRWEGIKAEWGYREAADWAFERNLVVSALTAVEQHETGRQRSGGSGG